MTTPRGNTYKGEGKGVMTVRKHLIMPRLVVAPVAILAALGLAVLAPASANACTTTSDFDVSKRLSTTGKGGTVSVKWAQSCTQADLNVYASVDGGWPVRLGTVDNGTRKVLNLPNQGMETTKTLNVYGESVDTHVPGLRMKSVRAAVDGLRPKTNVVSPTAKYFFAQAEITSLKNEDGFFGASNFRLFIQNTDGVLGSHTQLFPTGALADDFRPAWRKATLKSWPNGGKPSFVMMYFDPSEPITASLIRVKAGYNR